MRKWKHLTDPLSYRLWVCKYFEYTCRSGLVRLAIRLTDVEINSFINSNLPQDNTYCVVSDHEVGVLLLLLNLYASIRDTTPLSISVEYYPLKSTNTTYIGTCKLVALAQFCIELIVCIRMYASVFILYLYVWMIFLLFAYVSSWIVFLY